MNILIYLLKFEMNDSKDMSMLSSIVFLTYKLLLNIWTHYVHIFKMFKDFNDSQYILDKSLIFHKNIYP
jgi:hypothetical protein